MDCEDFKLFINSRDLSINFKAIENKLKIQILNIKHIVSKNFITNNLNIEELTSLNKRAKLIITFFDDCDKRSNEFLNCIII